jgi:hypothetical protein
VRHGGANLVQTERSYRAAVTESTIVVACRDCATTWPVDAEPRCADATHVHERHEVHRHRTTVALPGGGEVVGASYDEADPYTRAVVPDFGAYLDERWSPPWPHERVDGPD